nr:immunoglobulin heavy chain junction region [Macaca mulatta]
CATARGIQYAIDYW